MKNLLVTGGVPEDTTEISSDLGFTWTTVQTAKLPPGIYGLRAVSVDRRIFLFGDRNLITLSLIAWFYNQDFLGGRNADRAFDQVAEYDTREEVIHVVGSMPVKRQGLAVSLLQGDQGQC